MMEKLEKMKEKWNEFVKIPFTEIYWPHEYGPDYHQQEEMKDISWGIIKEAIKQENWIWAAWFLLHGVIRSHYWRARGRLGRKCKGRLRKIRGSKYYPHYVLDIDHYTLHWLWANGDRRDLFPQQVIDNLEEMFGYKAECCKYLPKGMSMYHV